MATIKVQNIYLSLLTFPGLSGIGGYHCFKDGVAFMDIRMLSLFKVQYHYGAEKNLLKMVTFFNGKCVVAPPTLIDKRIEWLEI